MDRYSILIGIDPETLPERMIIVTDDYRSGTVFILSKLIDFVFKDTDDYGIYLTVNKEDERDVVGAFPAEKRERVRKMIRFCFSIEKIRDIYAAERKPSIAFINNVITDCDRGLDYYRETIKAIALMTRNVYFVVTPYILKHFWGYDRETMAPIEVLGAQLDIKYPEKVPVANKKDGPKIAPPGAYAFPRTYGEIQGRHRSPDIFRREFLGDFHEPI